ncbi:MgtC/SapB family protein [Rhodovulum sp. YNF3179]|uniref:MgtC/SapB family protein n=1 Tax=Rhodovulum sp. YNF3179 TaxID=3425127 RepID=UPI003D346772
MFETLWSEFSTPFRATPVEVAALRLAAAMVLGGIIGFEREMHDKPAGLRTHMMIALAACLFTLASFELMEVAAAREDDNVRLDPLRLTEAITAGVAFLAAGTIITGGDKVRGLTTGAGMWFAGAVGLSCGIGNLTLAGLATGVGLVVLWLLRRVTRALGPDRPADD